MENAYKENLVVLILIDSLSKGGSERSLVENLSHYRASGIRPLIVCLNGNGKASFEDSVRAQGHRVRVLPKSRLDIGSSLFDSFLTRVRALRRILATEQPDLIHTTLPQASLVGRVAAWGMDVPVLSSLVNTRYGPERFRDPNITRWKMRTMQAVDAYSARLLTDHFHAVTHAVKESAVRRLGIAPSAVTVVERGRETKRLGRWSAERRRRARTRLGLGDHHEVLLNAGRQEYQKGQEHLLRAVEVLARDRPNLVLLVAGCRGSASPQLDRMQQHPLLQKHVRFLGHRDDVPELLAAADLFVFPSLFEGIGGAAIEAMALGLPIVASDIAPMREVLEAGHNALLTEPAAPYKLAGAIRFLLDDPERAAAFGRRSREIFEERFTLDRNARRMADLYYRVAASQTTAESISLSADGLPETSRTVHLSVPRAEEKPTPS